MLFRIALIAGAFVLATVPAQAQTLGGFKFRSEHPPHFVT